MLDHPKLVAQFWNAEKITQNANSTISYLKLNRKGAYGILGKKPQGAKLYELDNLEPCIFLDFTKLI